MTEVFWLFSSLFKSSMIASGPFAIADAAEVFKGEEHSSIEYFIGIFRTHIIDFLKSYIWFLKGRRYKVELDDKCSEI